MSQKVPAVIGGRYRVVGEIGRGAMGVVFEVEDPVNGGERLALKAMLHAGVERPDLVERFRREARASARIANPHVVRVVDLGTAAELDGKPFIVMELLTGRHLGAVLAERGRLPPREVCEVLRQAAHALDRAHAEGIVHRDFKPENLFLHALPDGRSIVKVLDFGVAGVLDEDVTAITPTGETVGTLRYMAPEQTRAETGKIGPRADVWAVAMVAVELLTGEPYWWSTKPSELVRMIVSAPMPKPRERWPFLPNGFDEWFFGSCARDPDARFPRVGDQVTVLEVLARKHRA